VDILIFFNNKIFQSIFWLEMWWNVAEHPNATFLQVWWGSWVLAGRKVACMAVWMDVTGFPGLRKKTVFDLKRRHNYVTGGRDLPQNVRYFLMYPMIPSLTL